MDLAFQTASFGNDDHDRDEAKAWLMNLATDLDLQQKPDISGHHAQCVERCSIAGLTQR
jgi:hypothetical protein